MDKIIYILTKRGIPQAKSVSFPDITIFKDDEGYWGVGEDPACFEKWCHMYVPNQKTYKKLLHNNGIMFMSHIIYAQNNESWKCIKNRFTSAKSEPPFTSIEEARLLSAVNGWLEPVLIDEHASALYYYGYGLNGT